MKFRLLLLALLVFPSVVFAAGQETPTIYVIKQGDTLWGLSERFIKDPYYWPDMWSKNSQVTNPHFIYPGQKLRVFPDRLEFVGKEQPAVKKTEAAAGSAAGALAETAPEKSYTLYGTEGFLADDSFKPSGLIVGAQYDRVILGVDDIVYTDIGSALNARSGDKYSIFQREAAVKHPLNGEQMGFKIIPLGSLQLTDVEGKSSRAIITKSHREITPGSFLLPYKEVGHKEITLKGSGAELKGYIVESASGAGIIAAGDVVYVDLGSDHGADKGNMLYIARDVKIDQRHVEGRIERLPQEILGAVVILEVGKKTSVALVVKSIETIYKGDRVVTHTR